MLRILFYDGDPQGKRLHKNASLIRNCRMDFELYLELVRRIKPFGDEKCIDDLLLSDDFDGTMINTFHPGHEEAIKSSVSWTELLGLPTERTILLCPAGGQYPFPGVQYVPCRGGNGHILDTDAKHIVGILSKFYRK